jgi:hypothetical protein
MPVNRRRSLLFIALIAAVGCGGSQTGNGQNGGGQNGNGQDGDGGTSGGQTGTDAGTVAFTEAVRGAAVQAVEAKLSTLISPDGTVDAASLKAYMASRPELSGVTSTGTGLVYGFFPDGSFYVAGSNRKPSGPGVNAHVKRGPAPRTATLRPRRNGTEIAPMDQVRLANALGVNFYSDASPKIAGYVSSRGYTPVPSGLDVEEMKAWQGDGAVYINSHGGVVTLKDGNPHAIIWTSTPYTDGDTTYLSEILPDSTGVSVMGIMSAPYDFDDNGKPVAETHYVITGNWIVRHMHFTPGSFVQLDVCNGGLLAAAFQQAGADLVGGWSNAVQDSDGARADQFVFDRLLGANDDEPESPPQRPFDATPVLNDLASRGYNLSLSGVDGSGNPVLAVFNFVGGASFGLLTPSIESISVDESAGRLTLDGLFGGQEESSMVTVGGTQLSNCDWSPTQVICDIPPGVSGDVIASKRDHDSNAVPLTEWTGEIDWKETNDFSDLDIEVKAQVSFRADVHASRTAPGTDPIKPTAALFAAEQVSVVSFQGTGQVCGPAGCGELTGDGDLSEVFTQSSVPPVSFNDSYFFHGYVNVQKMTLTLDYLGFVTSGINLVTPNVTVPFAVQVVPSLVLDANATSLDWTLSVGDDFSIADGSAHRVVPGNGGNGFLDLTWHFDVNNAPDPSRGEDDNAT